MPFNSEKILKSNTHYLKIFLQIWQVSFGFNSNSLSTVQYYHCIQKGIEAALKYSKSTLHISSDVL